MNELDDLFGYITTQSKTWKMLSLNDLMETGGDIQVAAAMSADDYNSYLQNGSITSSKLNTISARQITTSTLEAKVDVGTGTSGAYLRLDGPNNRFVNHDGTTIRVIIGKV